MFHFKSEPSKTTASKTEVFKKPLLKMPNFRNPYLIELRIKKKKPKTAVSASTLWIHLVFFWNIEFKKSRLQNYSFGLGSPYYPWTMFRSFPRIPQPSNIVHIKVRSRLSKACLKSNCHLFAWLIHNASDLCMIFRVWN